jgi:RNA polymerase sigma-70 factor (ECF subfamily)
MTQRTNAEWLEVLQQTGNAQQEALLELREYLLRAVYVYLRDRRPELTGLSSAELYELAEDFAQEALLSIRRNLDRFRGDAKFTTWAYRFVINEAASELRRRRFRHISLDDLSGQELAEYTSVLGSEAGQDPEVEATRRELIVLVLDIIRNELNRKQRVAILTVHFQGRSIQEVAELLDTSPNTLYKILHDGRKKIKSELLAHHYSAGDITGLFESLW